MRLLHKGLLSMVLAITYGAPVAAENLQTAIFAGGCFWCVESDFEKVRGVTDAVSGYTGGSAANASYKKVSSGRTRHLEAVKITYDADVVSYDTLIDIFWRTVDPTDAGGQFCDRGDSYRTAVFAIGDVQFNSATSAKATAQKELGQTIVTPVIPAGEFYPADDYHQNYHTSNKKVLTRFGRIAKKDAYKRYRKACGRDARVKQLWGNRAFVVSGS